MRSGEQIRSALVKFVGRWQTYAGTERSEAQTFLNELFECYGRNRKDAGALFEDAHSSTGIMDLHLPGLLIVEMKAPKETTRLDQHRKQALDYWHNSADVSVGRPAPQFVVLCSFHRFEIWEPGQYPNAPLMAFDLTELPDRYESLMVLAGDEPVFHHSNRELTKAAAISVARIYQDLLDREAAPPESIQRFILQMVWLFFAEDYGMVEGRPTEQTLQFLTKHGDTWSSYLMLGGLFTSLNDPNDHGRQGVLKGTQYVNGDLFNQPALVHLTTDEARELLRIAEYNWKQVDPTIFGSLIEGFLSSDRGVLGAHYTHEIDILKIVRPTIVKPWRARIDAVTTPDEGIVLLEELSRFRVLDPACGCGNFLYVAYRELRHLEYTLKARITELAKSSGLPVPTGLPYFPLANMQGIDIVPMATAVARVTLWMGHRQMIEKYGAAEPPLPLVSLGSIRTQDALRAAWPETDCIVGNPPFLGSQYMREAHGDDYLKWLSNTFGVGIKDFCVYWFRRAHQHLKPGQRAGLVGTNSISQNRARSASLEYVTANGGVITEAVSSQTWPGEAKVHVSLVNWVKSPSEPPTEFILDNEPVSGITAELKVPGFSTAEALPLLANKGRCFQGPIPVGDGFIITEQEASRLLAAKEATYRDVVRPYLVGDDIADEPTQRPRRWVIDFAQRPLEAAMKYPAALQIVRERVKPLRDGNSRKSRREKWWLFGEQAVGMRAALAGLPRYIAAGRVGKRLLLTWCDPWTCPSDLVYVFAFDDDYSMGMLSSSAHSAWAWSQSSTFKRDIRYTPTSAFLPFPWPYPVTDEQRERVAEASRRMIARRQEICAEQQFGLTRLYNLADEGAYTDLSKLHRELDEAVAACYGWPKAMAQDKDEIAQRLLSLNAEIAVGQRSYDPFAARDGKAVAQQLGLPMS
ncbi:class I SAM-dependent DNA methyltransferase [Micromonospora orduensis]|uniref:site-specific DNA-methyltransferase (adenine-specific) n=1 Tax=Micromonospora orduensis TaxID=1420891 RepID=A0A5C4QEC3_9ACTN|nr:DNA methyltransferase [Micromonospora orduensis]TNH25095.1 class I SAM-dependent DNA methyltransferase [Micromonospora orduensis]